MRTRKEIEVDIGYLRICAELLLDIRESLIKQEKSLTSWGR